MLNAREGQTYICTKSNESWWTEGKEYTVTLDIYGIPSLPDNDGYKWSSCSLNESSHQFELKDDTKMNTLEIEEGQIYIYTKAKKPWWTEGKEYNVVLNSDGIQVFVDNGGAKWPANDLSIFNNEFKLKENTFDLNNLTTEQLREYTGLVKDKENAENLLNDFIERMTK